MKPIKSQIGKAERVPPPPEAYEDVYADNLTGRLVTGVAPSKRFTFIGRFQKA